MNNLIAPNEPILVPFLKWAGGKRWFTKQYSNLLPKEFGLYLEPFLGSGAVFFYLQPRNALLSDSNPDLINTYSQIQINWRSVRTILQRHHRYHSEEYYYSERARIHRVPHEMAAQFIYLNRTCWNGLYRVNLRGQFNVPIGTKKSVILPSDDFQQTAEIMQDTKLVSSDFEDTILKANEGDFVFVDPPYVTRHNYNGFLKYNNKIFSWDDQERLCSAIGEAAQRGAKILVTNAAHDSINKLYRNLGRHIELTRRSILAASPDNRGVVTEIAILINYDTTMN